MPTARPQGVEVTASMQPYPIDGSGRLPSVSTDLALESSVRLFARALSTAWRAKGATGTLEVLQELNKVLKRFNEEHDAVPATNQLVSNP